MKIGLDKSVVEWALPCIGIDSSRMTHFGSWSYWYYDHSSIGHDTRIFYAIVLIEEGVDTGNADRESNHRLNPMSDRYLTWGARPRSDFPTVDQLLIVYPVRENLTSPSLAVILGLCYISCVRHTNRQSGPHARYNTRALIREYQVFCAAKYILSYLGSWVLRFYCVTVYQRSWALLTKVEAHSQSGIRSISVDMIRRIGDSVDLG